MIDLTDDLEIDPDDIYVVDSECNVGMETIDDGDIVMDGDVNDDQDNQRRRRNYQLLILTYLYMVK